MSGQIQFDESTARALERIYGTPDVTGQRAAVIQRLGLRQGGRVLDVGAGPGLLLYDLAETVGETGRAAGVDQSDPMLAIARRRCERLPQVELQRADATQLPFEDGAFDAVVSTQVYEYVPDMAAALCEVRRVLRPGGEIHILDTDWDSLVWNTTDRARMRRVCDAWDAHLHDPHLPATLGRKLTDAGFGAPRCEVIPIVNTSYHRHCYSAGIMLAIKSFVAGRPEVGETEAQAWLDELIERGASDDYFFSLNRYLWSATRI